MSYQISPMVTFMDTQDSYCKTFTLMTEDRGLGGNYYGLVIDPNRTRSPTLEEREMLRKGTLYY